MYLIYHCHSQKGNEKLLLHTIAVKVQNEIVKHSILAVNFIL